MKSTTSAVLAAFSILVIAPVGWAVGIFVGGETQRGIHDYVGFLRGSYWPIVISSGIMVAAALVSLRIRQTF